MYYLDTGNYGNTYDIKVVLKYYHTRNIIILYETILNHLFFHYFMSFYNYFLIDRMKHKFPINIVIKILN